MLIQSGYDMFAQALLQARREAQLPPFAHMALLRYPDKVWQCLQAIKQQSKSEGLTIMGPAPAPLAKKAGQHRMQLLFKSGSRQVLQAHLTQLRQVMEQSKIASGLRWSIDVDPIDLA